MERHPETGLPLTSEQQGFTFSSSSNATNNTNTEQQTEVSKVVPGGFSLGFKGPVENQIPTTNTSALGGLKFAGGLGGPHENQISTTKTASNPPFAFGGVMPNMNQYQAQQKQQAERMQGACMGIQSQFGYEKKKDNSAVIKALYDELTAIRTQIEHLTKTTDTIYKIMSQLQ